MYAVMVERGQPLPSEATEPAPVVDRDIEEWFLRSFHRLSTCRDYSFGVGPIPWDALDRYSRRAIIGVGIFLWSVMTMACGLAGNFWELFFARIGVAAGEAALAPAAFSMLSDLFQREKLGRHVISSVASAGDVAGRKK